LSAGQLKEASRACRKAIQARPDIPEAHLLLAEIHHQGGDAAKARESATRALRLRPGWSEAHVALGNAEALGGNFDLAEREFRAAIAAGTPSAGIHANLGHVLVRQGRLHEARQAYEQALARAPDALELHLNVARILGELGEKALAFERLRGVAERFPGSAQLQFALGNALSDLGQYEEAIPHYGQVLHLDAALFNQARALFAIGRNDEAIAGLRELLKRDARASEPREQLLRVLHASRRFAEMEALAREGRAIHPNAIVYAHQLGVALWWQERHEEAIAAFDAVEGLAQERTSAAYRESKLDQATSLLVMGRWREGWEAYQWRPTRITWRTRFPQVSEDPQAVAALRGPARILILGEQGLGDDLFFLRFAVALRSRGHVLRGALDQRLVPLLAGIPGLFDELAPSFAAAPEADLTILSGDLPLAAAQDLAAPLPLPVDPARRASFEARLREFGPPPYIGVTWRAGVLPGERKQQAMFYLVKEVPPADLGAALRPLKATVCILQRKPLPEDRERFVAALGRPAMDLSTVNDDLQDALAVLSILDDYVGVSNTNTHLRAGCPGKSARVLVPHNPEWRWELHGSRSSWFPLFTVYRQSARDGWSPTLEALTGDLAVAFAA
jgi:Tfp pilus assembly protein PilF